jgi:predicted dehydrogenase
MSEPPSDAPIRLGVIGLGREGLFYLERWRDDPAIDVLAACDRDPAALERASALSDRLTADAAQLFNQPGVDFVVLGVPTSEREPLGRQALAAGKHVLLAPPIAATLSETMSLLQAAKAAGREILVWPPWREEGDFRAASDALRSGLIGTPRLVRFERWEPMVRSESHGASRPLPRSVVYLLDQLVALAAESASTAFAAPLGETGRAITVGFRSGLRAVLTLHTTACARIDHGWAIDADRGGYTAGRRWIRTAEGELYEVPAEVPRPASLEAALRTVLSGGPPTVRAAESVRLAALIAAIACSSVTGNVEPVEETP